MNQPLPNLFQRFDCSSVAIPWGNGPGERLVRGPWPEMPCARLRVIIHDQTTSPLIEDTVEYLVPNHLR